MERRIPRHKGVYILPNLFTTGSLFSAFLGLIWATQGYFEDCAIAIFVSALLDGLDGKVARLTGTASEFGIQYDSLCDLVAFGITPAFLIYSVALDSYNHLGIAVSFLFAVCTALRLARFNVSTSSPSCKRFFTGLPSPAGGCAIASFVFFIPYTPEFVQHMLSGISLFLTAFVALLMVSNVRYAAFKEFGFLRAHPFRYMVFAIILFALIVSDAKFYGFLVLFGYIISGLVYTFFIMPRRGTAHIKETETTH